MTKKDKIIKILGWMAVAFSASAFFLPVMNPDIFWHLSAGKYAAAHLAPPRFDFLSWPSAGREWVDFEWASQVIYYLIYLAGGFKALVAFKAAVLVLLLLVFRRLALLYGRGAALVPALPFLAAALVSSSDLRPENFTLLFFTVTLYFLEKSRLGGIPRGRAPRVKLFLFFAVWINLHAGCFYGLALLGLYAAGEFFAEQLPFIYGGPAVRPGRSLEYLKLFLLGLAATLVNPYGWKICAVLANHSRYAGALTEYIQEWGAFRLGNPYQWPYALALAGVAACLVLFLLRRRHSVYPHLACLLFFAWTSAEHARHIPFFVLTGLAFTLALPWESLRLPRLPGPAYRAAAAGLLLAVVGYYSSFIWTQYTGRASFFSASSPNLARFLKTNAGELSGLRLYNYWAWGGWLGWELAPEYKVFVDGRYLFHDKIEELVEARTGARNWTALIAKYDFDLMLIALDEPLVPIKQHLSGGKEQVFWRPAYLFYLPKKEWAVIYWDYKVAAVVRRSALSPAWLAAREFKYLRPADIANLVAPVLAGDVPLAGLERDLRLYLGSHPGGSEALSNTALVDFYRNIRIACAKKGAACRS